MRALRILCLHGFRSSGAGLQAQMRRLVAGLRPEIEFIYADAPALATGGHGWWNATPIEGAEANARRYEGWAETRDWAVSFFRQRAPIDGIFGFSQGAALAGLLVGMRAPDRSSTAAQPLRFESAVLASGFLSNDPRHAQLYEARASFTLPSFHLIGRRDRIVAPHASLELAARFDEKVVVEHDAGHVIPSTAIVRDAVGAFWTECSARAR